MVANAKKIYKGKEAREKVRKGLNILADAVVSTLGPTARNVIVDTQNQPDVLHDGKRIADSIILKDPGENAGAKLIRQAAEKTNTKAGDGTTSSVLIAQVISNKGLDLIDADGSKVNGVKMKEGFQKGLDILLEEIEKIKTDVKEGDIEKIATISSQDERIGSLVSEILKKVGKDGVVSVQEGKSTTMSTEYVEGMEIPSGYISAYFVTNTDKGEVELNDVVVLLTDRKFGTYQEIVPALEAYMKVPRKGSLLIICPDVSGEALAALVVNKMKGSLPSLAVKVPGINSREVLEDLSALTGATIMSEDAGKKIENITIEDFGFCAKVWADKSTCKIIDGKGKEEAIKVRVEKIRTDIEKATDEHEKEELHKRLAKLVAGVGVINVGATTEAEYSDIREKVIDCVAAVRAAMESGVVQGGGITLLRIREKLIPLLEKLEGDQKIAVQIFYDSLECPFLKIVENSGENPVEMLKAVRTSKEKNYGYNALTGKLGDISEVLDPTLVLTETLINAVSIAKMVITCDILVVDDDEEKEKK